MSSKFTIHADDVQLGVGVVIEDGVTISAKFGARAKKVVVGDNVYIGHGCIIQIPEITIGDYSVIHRGTEISGYAPCTIGHCSWIGPNCMLNSHEPLTIGRGVGIGAQSQLWTHLRFGDTLQGCRWESYTPMVIEDDVWFVGHCIVSPIHAEARSMALVGSVVTRNMVNNHVYAGVPAVDITEKVGPQFAEVTPSEKYTKLSAKLEEFYQLHPALAKTLRVVNGWQPQHDDDGFTSFDVASRTYNKRQTPQEVAFMRSLLALIKFYPR